MNPLEHEERIKRMSETETSPNSKKKAFSGKALASSKSFLILVVLIITAGVGGILWYLHISQYEQTDNATLVGHVHPVAPRVGGTVTQVLVDDDEYVQKGQVLAELDPTDYQLALSEAEHNLMNARAQAKTAFSNISYTQRQADSQITQAKGTVGASQSAIAQSRQSVQEAKAAVRQAQHLLEQQAANYEKAQADYTRFKGVDPDAVSAQQIDTAVTAFRSAEASKNSAQSALQQAQARLSQAQSGVLSNVSKLTQSKGLAQGAQAQTLQLNVVKSQFEGAQAAVKMAEDQVRQARLNLSYSKIVAPTAGRIGKKTVEIGQRVQPGEPLMSVVNPEVWVVANFKETQVGRMVPGQMVDVEVDAFPSHHFKGIVNSYSPASGAQFALLPPENATGNFTKIVQRIPVKILLTKQSVKGYEDRLVPGLSTVVSVKVSESPQKKAH